MYVVVRSGMSVCLHSGWNLGLCVRGSAWLSLCRESCVCVCVEDWERDRDMDGVECGAGLKMWGWEWCSVECCVVLTGGKQLAGDGI